MQRLILVALAVFSVLSFLEEAVRPYFAPLFRAAAEFTFVVLLFGDNVSFQTNVDPQTSSSWDTNVVITGENELFGVLCDSTLVYSALVAFLALWVASPSRGRKLAALWRGLGLLYLFLVARLGLMVLETVANHECKTPELHWSLLRQEWFGSFVAFVNWEVAMDLVVALVGPFLVWAIVCGRDLSLPLGFRQESARGAAASPPAVALSPGGSAALAGFDPFSRGDLNVVSEDRATARPDLLAPGAASEDSPERRGD